MVLGTEVYGRWSDDALELLRELVALKAAQAQPLLRGAAAAAWTTRWWNLLSVGVQRACSETLLCSGGADLLQQTGEEVVPGLATVFDETDA